MPDAEAKRVLWGVGTSRTIRAHWALHELDLPYERRPIQPRTGETETPEFTALSARQKIPLLQDNGLVITESAAIVAYLSDAYGQAHNRLIPADDSGSGGKQAGCAVFIDRQLAGSFGDSRRLYMQPPFAKGTPSQGPQSPIVPRDGYRSSLAALDTYCKTTFAGKSFGALNAEQQDQVLSGLEKDEIKLSDGSGKVFFESVLANAMEGFFADPIYGGNRDMAGWKLIGFPGARYDYREHVEKHNQPYPLPPVSILGRSDWSIPG